MLEIGRPITAHLSILRTPSAPLILVELTGFAPATADVARRFGLTHAEAIVLLKLRDGLGNAAIARELDVSIDTVRTHVRRVLAKLGVETRLQALIAAQIT